MKSAGHPFTHITQCILSSVVPLATHHVLEQLESKLGFRPLLNGMDVWGNLEIAIDNPAEIGADLVANAVAAYARFNQACIVVDFGTALTFTTVSDTGAIQGVSIAPGLKTAIKALFLKAAQLPEVPLQVPETVIGKNTIHAIQSGVLWGYVGLVQSLISEFNKR